VCWAGYVGRPGAIWSGTRRLVAFDLADRVAAAPPPFAAIGVGNQVPMVRMSDGPPISVHSLRGMNPGTPLPITVLNRTFVVMRFAMSRMASSGSVEISKFS
jgi:hypothetical protein